MSFAKVYPMLIVKAERKGRTRNEVFTDRLTPYSTSKGTIRLPLIQTMPLELIADIAQ